MNKEQIGIVIETNNPIAKVKVARHGDCENCGSCPGSKAMVLEVNNQFGAKTGDRVIFEMKEQSMLKAAFIVYILPLLSIFIGVEIGDVIAQSINGHAYGLQIAGGIIAFVLSIVYIVYYEKSSRSNINKLPKIVKLS